METHPKLTCDEHLSFAVQSRIIDFVYVCSHDQSYNYQYYENIFNIDHYLWCQWKKKNNNQPILDNSFPVSEENEENLSYSYNNQKIIECSLFAAPVSNPEGPSIYKDNYDMVLDDSTLKLLLDNFNFFQNPFQHQYLLDFDMDYFRTRKAFTPQHNKIINELIKNSCAITIATETSCVEEKWEDNKPVNHAENFDLLLTLITNAIYS